MKRIGIALAALLTFLAAPSAADAAITLYANNPNQSFSVDYTGLVGGTSTSNVTADGNFVFTGTTNNNLTYNFNYSLLNDSIYSSRISSFGFDVTSNATIQSISSTGYYGYASQNANYPEGVGNIELCFSSVSNGNCTGNGGGLTQPDGDRNALDHAPERDGLALPR